MSIYESPKKKRSQLPVSPLQINTFDSSSKKFCFNDNGSPARIVARNASNESLEHLRRAPAKDPCLNMPSDRKELYGSLKKEKNHPTVCTLFSKDIVNMVDDHSP